MDQVVNRVSIHFLLLGLELRKFSCRCSANSLFTCCFRSSQTSKFPKDNPSTNKGWGRISRNDANCTECPNEQRWWKHQSSKYPIHECSQACKPIQKNGNSSLVCLATYSKPGLIRWWDEFNDKLSHPVWFISHGLEIIQLVRVLPSVHIVQRKR